MSIWIVVIVTSELIALWLIWKLWRSNEHLLFKIALSILAFVPVLGPFFVIWNGSFPSEKPRILQDRLPKQSDFYNRWRHVFEEKSPVRRYRYWRELIKQYRGQITVPANIVFLLPSHRHGMPFHSRKSGTDLFKPI